MRCATARRLGQLDDSTITFCDALITPVQSCQKPGRTDGRISQLPPACEPRCQ